MTFGSDQVSTVQYVDKVVDVQVEVSLTAKVRENVEVRGDASTGPDQPDISETVEIRQAKFLDEVVGILAVTLQTNSTRK